MRNDLRAIINDKERIDRAVAQSIEDEKEMEAKAREVETPSELDDILNKLYNKGYVCGVGAQSPDRYPSIDLVVSQAKAAIERLMVKARIDENETPLVNMMAGDSDYISIQYFKDRIAQLSNTKGETE